MTDRPHSSWEIALNDLKTYGASGHAGEIDHLRSVEICGGLVRDYVRGLEEQLKRRDGLLLQCASVLQATHPNMTERLRKVVAESSLKEQK